MFVAGAWDATTRTLVCSMCVARPNSEIARIQTYQFPHASFRNQVYDTSHAISLPEFEGVDTFLLIYQRCETVVGQDTSL